MDVTRRKAIAVIAALPAVALASKLLPNPQSGLQEERSLPPQADDREAAVEEWFGLVRRWQMAPAGSRKELLFREAYETGVKSGLFTSLRVRELDRELQLS